MVDSRAGHHGDVAYVFEDAGFDSTPTDSTFKVFGSNATMDTFDGAEQAVRVYNASRRAADIIAQNFDGGWGVTHELTEPPWWLAGIFGQPTSTNVSGSLYDYTYDLDNSNDPVPLRLYAPTEGFSEYKVVPGCYPVSASIEQGEGGNPELNITGGYARKPFTDTSLSPTVPDFGEDPLTTRDAEVQVDNTTLAKAQNASVSLETGTEGVSEIGTGNMVDFLPKAFEPDVTYDKIVATNQSVDLFDRFIQGNSVAVDLLYDNGLTGEDEYSIDINVQGSFPNSLSESGRNDPGADLMEELQDMALDCVITVTTDAGSSGNPPGITL